MGASNRVIAGDYNNYVVKCDISNIYLEHPTNFRQRVNLNTSTVANYDIMDEERKKSGTSMIGRAAVGAMILGPVGLLAGATAKRKGIYTVTLNFSDGKRSMIEIDEKRYKQLLRSCF